MSNASLQFSCSVVSDSLQPMNCSTPGLPVHHKLPEFTQTCPTLCNRMECSTPGFPVHHQPPEPDRLMSIESVMPSNHLILCHPLLFLPSILPNIRVFSSESVLHIRWPKYWSFNFNISPFNEYSGLISFRIDLLISLLSKGLSRVFSSTTVQKHRFFSAQPSLWSNSHIRT